MLICNQITYSIEPLYVKEFKLAFQEIVQLALLHKGCHKFEFYQVDATREMFLIIEIYKSEKSEKKFKESQAYQHTLKTLIPMIESSSNQALRLTTCLTKQGYWSEI